MVEIDLDLQHASRASIDSFIRRFMGGVCTAISSSDLGGGISLST